MSEIFIENAVSLFTVCFHSTFSKITHQTALSNSLLTLILARRSGGAPA